MSVQGVVRFMTAFKGVGVREVRQESSYMFTTPLYDLEICKTNVVSPGINNNTVSQGDGQER